MKTLIVGRGIIGTTYGWALAVAGADVTHLVRRGVPIGDVPLRLDVLDERKGHPTNSLPTYRARYVDTIGSSDGYELVMVPGNAYQLDEVLPSLAPVAGDALFLVMALTWEGTEAIDRVLPRDRYVLAYPDAGGTLKGDLHWVNLGAELHVGLLDGQPAGSLEGIRALFGRADIALDVQEHILHWLWVHAATSVPFAAGLPKHDDFKAMLADGPLLATCFRASKEVLGLCTRRGVDLKRFPDIGYMSWPTWVTTRLMRFMYWRNRSMQRFTAHAASPGSRRETEEMYRAMLRTAGEFGDPVPDLRSLGRYLGV
jgi:2-dehydropantoate 2-reductase